MEEVVLDRYWCDSCQDEHEETEYRCTECGAVVEPGIRAVEDRRYVAGLTYITGGLRAGHPAYEDIAGTMATGEPWPELELTTPESPHTVLVHTVRCTELELGGPLEFIADRLTLQPGEPS